MSLPIVLIVTVEIVEDRIDEFLRVIEADAIGSRTAENGGCLRFDVIRDNENPLKFLFYEAYQDAEALERHRNYDHFAAWSAFKASGGVASQSVVKGQGIFFQSN